MATKLYYRTSTGIVGPITVQQLVEAVKTGEVQRTDLVRKENSEKWTQASQVKGLFSEVANLPPIANDVLVENQVPPLSDNDAAFMDSVGFGIDKELDASKPANPIPPVTVTPIEFDSPAPKKSRRMHMKIDDFTPRKYYWIDAQIGLYRILGMLLAIVGLIALLFSLTDRNSREAIVPAIIAIASSFGMFLMASILTAFLDLLSDSKRTADRMDKLIECEIEQYNS